MYLRVIGRGDKGALDVVQGALIDDAPEAERYAAWGPSLALLRARLHATKAHQKWNISDHHHPHVSSLHYTRRYSLIKLIIPSAGHIEKDAFPSNTIYRMRPDVCAGYDLIIFT